VLTPSLVSALLHPIDTLYNRTILVSTSHRSSSTAP
jgi:hypothetical protein